MGARKLGELTKDGKAAWREYKEAERRQGGNPKGRRLSESLALHYHPRRAPVAQWTVTAPTGAKLTAYFMMGQRTTGNSSSSAFLRNGPAHTEAELEWSGHTLAVKSDGTLWLTGDDAPLAAVSS